MGGTDRTGRGHGREAGDRAAFLAPARRGLAGGIPANPVHPPPGPLGGAGVPRPRYRNLDPDDLVGTFARSVAEADGTCHVVEGDVPDDLLDRLVDELGGRKVVATAEPEAAGVAGGWRPPARPSGRSRSRRRPGTHSGHQAPPPPWPPPVRSSSTAAGPAGAAASLLPPVHLSSCGRRPSTRRQAIDVPGSATGRAAAVARGGHRPQPHRRHRAAADAGPTAPPRYVVVVG